MVRSLAKSGTVSKTSVSSGRIFSAGGMAALAARHVKAPSTNNQTPERLQDPSSRTRARACMDGGAWFFFGFWSLEFGASRVWVVEEIMYEDLAGLKRFIGVSLPHCAGCGWAVRDSDRG